MGASKAFLTMENTYIKNHDCVSMKKLALCNSSATSQYTRGHQGMQSSHVDNPHVSEPRAHHQKLWSDRSRSAQQPIGDTDNDPLPVASHFDLYGDRQTTYLLMVLMRVAEIPG